VFQNPPAYKDAHMISGAQHAVKGASVSHERNMADPCRSQAITNKKDSSTNFEVALPHSGSKIFDMGCESSGPREKRMIQIIPAVDFLSKPSVPQVLQSNQAAISIMSPNSRIIHGGICSSSGIAGEQNSSSNMQVIAKRPAHDVNDISKGEESVSIPIINARGNGILPPPFHYMPFNITFQKAHVNISLARIGDDSCCSDCFEDCVAEPLPCACATETGGNFAYTRDGLLTEIFLDSCISMLREPDKHPLVYCKICPNELVKIKVTSDSQNTKVNPDPCKGHQITKFIKECWSKCGCSRSCGNRVVQRGITRPLQVSHVYPFKILGLPFCTKDKLVINLCQLANMMELTIHVQLCSYICI
jgi:hypothetical protein